MELNFKLYRKDSKFILPYTNWEDMTGWNEFKILSEMYNFYEKTERINVYCITIENIIKSIFYYIFEDTKKFLNSDIVQSEKCSIEAYFLTRFKFNNPNSVSFFEKIEPDEFDIVNIPPTSSFDFEFERRGYKIHQKIGGNLTEEQLKSLPRKYPKYGKKLVKIKIMQYYGVGANHYYVKFDVETNPYIEVDHVNKIVNMLDPWNGTDRNYDIEEKFDTHQLALDWINKIKKEKFNENEYIVLWDNECNITRRFYSIIGD